MIAAVSVRWGFRAFWLWEAVNTYAKGHIRYHGSIRCNIR